MKITICGSIAFIDEMQEAKKKLEELGHDVRMPPTEITSEEGSAISVKEYYRMRKAADANDAWVWKQKEELIHEHFRKIEWADAILVTNFLKNGIPNYIGGNTLVEMGLALYLKKKIFLLNPIPGVSYTEEILGMHPVVLNGDLSVIA